jgi:hypothetical protein
LQLLLVGELPEETTFVNTNRTLTPPNSVLLAYGWNFVNQTTLTSYLMDTFQVPFDIHEQEWYEVRTSISEGKILSLAINEQLVFNISISDYWIGGSTSTSMTTGSFGFGPYQDQAAYIKNVTVTSTDNGTILYNNPMTNKSAVLAEYGVQENYASICLDGAKRDRLVWLGDFFHTSKLIGITTERFDFARGTLQYFIDWQLPIGQFPLDPPIGYPSSSGNIFAEPDGFYGLPDYQILGLIAFFSYIEESNDLAFIVQAWPALQSLIQWSTSYINSTTGLVTFEGYDFAFVGPADGGSAISCALVQALNGAWRMALAINDTVSAASYSDTANTLATAINAKLWNEELGIYSTSLDDLGNYSVAGISFAITSGVATPEQALRSISLLSNLRLGPGYKDSSAVDSSDLTTNISPNTNGFLLSALMEANQTAETKLLLDQLWSAMVINETTSTGASWEYVNQQNQPGLGLYTSLSHPWGGAATYILTKYIAGIRPIEFGYKTWVIEPAWIGFNLTNVFTKIETPFGPLSVSWEIIVYASDDVESLHVQIVAPAGTSGQFIFNGSFRPSSSMATKRAAAKKRTMYLEGGETHDFMIKLEIV